MEENRQNTLLLTVIAVATLLVAVVGATFAYFTSTGEGTNSTTTVTVSSGDIVIEWGAGGNETITLTYAEGANGFQPQEFNTTENSSTGGLPTPLAKKVFTVKATNRTNDEQQLAYINYAIDFLYTSNFSDNSLVYRFTSATAPGVTFNPTNIKYDLNTYKMTNVAGGIVGTDKFNTSGTGFDKVSTLKDFKAKPAAPADATVTDLNLYGLPGLTLSGSTKTGSATEYGVQLGTGSFNGKIATGNYTLEIWYFDNNQPQDYDKSATLTNGRVVVRGHVMLC